MTWRAVWLWLPVALYMAGISVLSSFSTGPDLPGIFEWDKLKHYIAYAGLATLVARAFGISKPAWGLPVLIIASIGVSSAYGVTDEIHQYFVPNRCCDLADWFADVLGSATGAILVSSIYYLRRHYGGRPNGR